MRMALPPIKRAIVGGSLAELRRILLPRTSVNKDVCWVPSGAVSYLYLKRGRSEMKVAVVGRGNVGGGLADLWETAGHEVRRIGREGGDVSDAEAVLVAVPGAAIAEALDNVRGIEGKTVIDATNLWG